MVKYDLTVFQEPRGVMRVFQFIFAICALLTTLNFEATVTTSCGNKSEVKAITIDYPFAFGEKICPKGAASNASVEWLTITADVSSDAQFFVATGVLSILYCIFIVAVYTTMDEIYKTKSEVPLADFMLTTILAIFWLSGAAAWSNGAGALKQVTDTQTISAICKTCSVLTSSFSRLNISLLLGYLNFFLWGSDLWFLYKETIWFRGRQGDIVGAGGSGAGSPRGNEFASTM